MSLYLAPVQTLRRLDYAGNGQIAVVVDELGVVGPYRAALYSMATQELLERGLSDASGQITFKNYAVIPQGYFAVALDHGADPVNGAISTHITPEPMA